MVVGNSHKENLFNLDTMKIFRKGAIGALADEYEKALKELTDLLKNISDENFKEIADNSLDKDFQSIRNIVLHIVDSGYIYANHIRKRFGNAMTKQEIKIETVDEAFYQLDMMFQYTLETFEDKWLLTDEELLNTIIKTSWTTYDLEAIIEHAIVHVLRHRRQIEKLIAVKN